ncbi:hypothetical protein AABD61_08350 [Edwardsiella piscicida]|uniref:hypothetical protein n=1 Tax=Edwardsiella piscicida TaxID=1263550 RepID=UPI00370D50F5
MGIIFFLYRKMKYVYYTFLFHKTKNLKNKTIISQCMAFVIVVILLTILYLSIDYIPPSNYLSKLIQILPDWGNNLFTNLKKHGHLIAYVLLGIELVALRVLFTLYIKTPPLQKRKIVNDLTIEKIAKYERVNILSYFGSIEKTKGIKVVVISENSDLDLASLSSTSISGRIRNMSAQRNNSGDIIHDWLNENITSFKENAGRYNNFDLGTCVEFPSPELHKYGIEYIIHAASIKKNNDNTIYCDK